MTMNYVDQYAAARLLLTSLEVEQRGFANEVVQIGEPAGVGSETQIFIRSANDRKKREAIGKVIEAQAEVVRRLEVLAFSPELR